MFRAALSILAAASVSIAGCTPQAEGTCSFYMEIVEATLSDAEYQCGIYNHACNAISNFATCEPGLSITSQLPYTVDVTHRGGDGKSLYADFNYAGSSYSKDSSSSQIEDCSSGLATLELRQGRHHRDRYSFGDWDPELHQFRD
ncbi:uncharacterized protein PG986_010104 [Apiospora aurea]|uniref:Uncharacterized protein n=1 Tax=Apiospora aurea TaxID=335848 RepID=A0ABR1Q9J6_9PEZI